MHRKILFVTRSPEYGGTEKHLLDLVKRLSERGVDVEIICLEEDIFSERLTPANLHKVDVRCANEIDTMWKWFWILRSSRADVVVFVRSWVWCFPWYVSVIACLAGISRRFGIVHLPATGLPSTEGGFAKSLIRSCQRLRKIIGARRLTFCCTATICVSEAVKKSLVNEYHLPKHKIITIHNGVSLSEFGHRPEGRSAARASLGINAEEFLIVCIARLSAQKRVDVLLSAMALVLKSGVQCRCLVVGDGPLREQLSQQADAFGISANVSWEGFREDVKPYLYASDLFVLTSDFEGLPLSILEAMASGLPCVVTDVGGNAEVVRNGLDGFVVAPKSPEAVALAILKVANNRQKRAQMSEMARSNVSASFDIEAQMAEMQAVMLD